MQWNVIREDSSPSRAISILVKINWQKKINKVSGFKFISIHETLLLVFLYSRRLFQYLNYGFYYKLLVMIFDVDFFPLILYVFLNQ